MKEENKVAYLFEYFNFSFKRQILYTYDLQMNT